MTVAVVLIWQCNKVNESNVLTTRSWDCESNLSKSDFLQQWAKSIWPMHLAPDLQKIYIGKQICRDYLGSI